MDVVDVDTPFNCLFAVKDAYRVASPSPGLVARGVSLRRAVPFGPIETLYYLTGVRILGTIYVFSLGGEKRYLTNHMNKGHT